MYYIHESSPIYVHEIFSHNVEEKRVLDPTLKQLEPYYRCTGYIIA